MKYQRNGNIKDVFLKQNIKTPVPTSEVLI